MQQAGMSLPDPAQVPVHAALAFFLLKPLEAGKGILLGPRALGVHLGSLASFYGWGKLKLGEGKGGDLPDPAFVLRGLAASALKCH